jgi:hypothetical protein
MNNKGQIGVGAIVVIAIGVIVALILFQASAQNVGGTTTLSYKGNQTVTTGANGSTIYLLGQGMDGTNYYLRNSTNDYVVNNANFTFYKCVNPANGQVDNCMTTNTNTNPEYMAYAKLNVSYSYEPDGYIPESGSRSIAGLIVLLAAIGVAVFVLSGIKKPDF